jgi:hypothetical protein
VLNTLPILLLSANLFAPVSQPIETQEQRIAQDACVRSIPTPIVKKSVFPNTSFVLKKTIESGWIVAEGIEKVKFNNGDRLLIMNSGCESFAIAFHFETNRLIGNLNDPKYLYRRSAGLMKQILKGLNSPIDLKQGIVALENYEAKNSEPKLDTEIEYGGFDIRSAVKLGEVKKAANGRTIVQVLFYYGPL